MTREAQGTIFYSSRSKTTSRFRMSPGIGPSRWHPGNRAISAPKQYGAIDVGHVASMGAEGQTGRPDPACVLALVRALQYNTFFTHLDLSTANAAAGCWGGEDPARTSDVASGPMALAVQVCRLLARFIE